MAQSDGTAAPNRQKRRKRKWRPKEEFESYLMMVTSWSYYFSFHPAGGSRFDTGPYSELSLLKFCGRPFEVGKRPFRRIEVTLSGRAGMLEEKWEKPPKSVGIVSTDHDVLHAYVFVPAERMAELAAAGAHIQMISIDTTRIKRRSGAVRGIMLNSAREFLDY